MTHRENGIPLVKRMESKKEKLKRDWSSMFFFLGGGWEWLYNVGLIYIF